MKYICFVSGVIGIIFITLNIQCKVLDKPIFKIEKPFSKDVHFIHDSQNLYQAVDVTCDFLEKLHLSKFISLNAGLLSRYGVTVDDVKATLKFVQKTLEQSPKKMVDKYFLEENFDFYRWYVKSEHGHVLHGHYGPPDYIRTTSYLITQIPGSLIKTSKYNVPLYSVPTDEKDMTPAHVEQNREQLLRFRYTRQHIIDGALHKCPETTVLGWVTLEDYKELVLQGSAIITFKKGIKKLCRVAKSNNKKGSDQYYFFSIKDKSIDPKKTKFPIKPDPVPGVTLAGNIQGLGLGKLFFMVSHNHRNHTLEGRFGLLTDTGEAFKDNFHQVDMFAGYFAHKKDFQQYMDNLSHTAKMYCMIKKRVITST